MGSQPHTAGMSIATGLRLSQVNPACCPPPLPSLSRRDKRGASPCTCAPGSRAAPPQTLPVSHLLMFGAPGVATVVPGAQALQQGQRTARRGGCGWDGGVPGAGLAMDPFSRLVPVPPRTGCWPDAAAGKGSHLDSEDGSSRHPGEKAVSPHRCGWGSSSFLPPLRRLSLP